MKTRFNLILAMIITLASCQKETTSQTSYKDLKIEKFEYASSSSAGGTLKPTIQYSYTEVVNWSDGRCDTRTLTTGAECSFLAGEAAGFSVSKDGTATVPAIDGLDDAVYDVTLKVSIGNAKAQAACRIEQTASVDISYSDLMISKFAYPVLSGEGGRVTPDVKYSYTRTRKSSSGESRTDTLHEGAELTFSFEDVVGMELDAETGALSAELNGFETKDYSVHLDVSLGDLSASGDATVTRLGREDGIVSSDTQVLKLRLGPHKCVIPIPLHGVQEKWSIPLNQETLYDSISDDGYEYRNMQGSVYLGTDGLYQNYYWPKSETVSVKGTEIPLLGGSLVRIDHYKSGKADTTVVKEAEFTTGLDFCRKGDIDPPSYYRDGYWVIPQGVGATHTLTATVDDVSQTLKIEQHDDYPIDTLSYPIRFYKDTVYTQRDVMGWANYSDYPVGSNPKWKKDNGTYVDPYCTKDLHPDGDRDVIFYLESYCDYRSERVVYLSGNIDPEKVTRKGWNAFWFLGGVTITATADVKLTDGTVRHVEYEYWWKQRDNSQEYYGNLNSGSYTVRVPVIEDAAEDFVWNFSFKLDLDDDIPVSLLQFIKWFNLREDTNYYERESDFGSYQIVDHRKTIDECLEERNMHSFFCNSYERPKKLFADKITEN